MKLNFPDVEPWDLTWSCALDIADSVQQSGYSLTLETTGRMMNLTRERVRQVEDESLARANASLRKLLGSELDEIAAMYRATAQRRGNDNNEAEEPPGRPPRLCQAGKEARAGSHPHEPAVPPRDP